MRQTLLTVTFVWYFAGASFYFGCLSTLRLFLYPSWKAITPESAHAHFTLPTQAATKFFTVAVPTWMVAGMVLIVTEWGEPLLWTVLLAYAALLGTTCVAFFGNFPINREIMAGVRDQARLSELLVKWMKINDLRWVAAIVMWGSLCWYAVAKADLPAALK